MRSLIFPVSLLVVVAVFLAGCNVFQEGGQQSGGGGEKVLNTYYGADIPDLNSTTTTDSYSFEVLYNVNEGLYQRKRGSLPPRRER